MWLIDTKTLKLVFKTDPSQVRYAILSHTWEEDEVSFQEFQKPHLARYKKGYNKIEMTCRIAREKDGIEYAWVDTCCIDKSSSAELSEAINSMFRYYELSTVCFVHLCDLPSIHGSNPSLAPGLSTGPPPSFSRCRWLTRGWTLQELIAPRTVRFYDASWSYRGSKDEWAESIALTTGIHAGALSPWRQLHNYSVATRFSWASKRETTRKEDMAYCLLGIFGVYMPLLYGESENAFLRLQEEICKATNDLSIFAWTAAPRDDEEFRGLFARSPAEFRTSLTREPHVSRLDKEFAITNKGLRFDTSFLADYMFVEGCPNWMLSKGGSTVGGQVWADFHVMDLECFVTGLETGKTGKNTMTPVGIYLAKLPGGYARISPRSLAKVESRETFNVLMEVPQTIYAFKTISQAAFYSLESEYRRQVAVKLNTGGMTILQAEPHEAWHPQNNVFRIQPPFTCFWLLECCFGNHTTFECLVICKVSLDTQTGGYEAKAQLLVEAEGVWNLDHCKFSKPPRHRFHEKTATRLFQEWQARKDKDSCRSAVHAGPDADAVVSISEPGFTTDGHYRLDMSVKYVEPARELGDQAKTGFIR